MVTEADHFPVHSTTTPEGKGPLPVEQCDRATATLWTLHLPTCTPKELATRLLLSGAEALTGEYLGGDSYEQWAEPAGDDVPALHVYFTAANEARALAAAEALTWLAGYQMATVSTAGDWAEQFTAVARPPAR